MSRVVGDLSSTRYGHNLTPKARFLAQHTTTASYSALLGPGDDPTAVPPLLEAMEPVEQQHWSLSRQRGKIRVDWRGTLPPDPMVPRDPHYPYDPHYPHRCHRAPLPGGRGGSAVPWDPHRDTHWH